MLLFNIIVCEKVKLSVPLVVARPNLYNAEQEIYLVREQHRFEFRLSLTNPCDLLGNAYPLWNRALRENSTNEYPNTRLAYESCIHRFHRITDLWYAIAQYDKRMDMKDYDSVTTPYAGDAIIAEQTDWRAMGWYIAGRQSVVQYSVLASLPPSYGTL